MFAYCENNPVMKQDPTGELGVIASCLVGGAVGVVSSYIGAKVTGQDFTLKDAAISFGLGALSYSPLGETLRLVMAAVSFKSTYDSVRESGATTADAIGCGMLAAGFSYGAPSNLKCLGPINVGTKAVLDLTFGTAGSSFSNYATKSAKDKGKKNNKKQIIVSNQSRWDNMTQHYRGQVIKH